MRRGLLALLCCATAAACAWLVCMYFVLQHDGYMGRAAIACLFVLQSVLTLVALARAGRAGWLRIVVPVGALGIVGAGAAALYSTLSGGHFEGFAVIIGGALVAQGLLTLWQFALARRA